MNLILTPVYRAYDKVIELCQALDQLTVNPFLHILIDDDSSCGEFPVQPTKHRRIILLKRDASGMIHKNGGGQAIQLGYEWAHHQFINEQPNSLPYEHIWLIESDVIPLEQGWDQKMIEIKNSLPLDWLTLDVQSVDEAGNLTHPTTISPRLGFAREDLEVMKYPDFQVCLFSPRIFEAGIKFSDYPSHFDINFGNATVEKVGGRHFRTTLLKAKHYFYQSRQHLSEVPKE